MSESGGPKTGLMDIGKEAKPPFAVLPDPPVIFLNRAKRLEALAPGHPLEAYLRFLATVTRTQHEILPNLPIATLPSADRIAQALEHGMPPIARTSFELDDTAMATVERLIDRLAAADLPPATASIVQSLQQITPAERRVLASAVLSDARAADDIAQRALIAAGLQVHFTRLGALLNADDLKPITDGICPTCGSGPMTSSVVGWPNAHNSRFCACPLCSTMWNVVRVKCVLCSTTEGISYHTIEGQPETVKAETCEKCHAYVKILYQVNDAPLEPMADDVATLGLDMLMTQEGWKRGGHNPFLMGY